MAEIVEWDDSVYPPMRGAARATKAASAAPHAAAVPERRTLTAEQAQKAAKWAERRGLSEEYGRLYFALPLAVKHWNADDARAVAMSLFAEPLTLLWDRLKKLESANAELREELEAREYKGVFDTARDYQKHNSVSHDGHLWIAKANTSSKPGSDPAAWVLAVRRGRDGRDVR